MNETDNMRKLKKKSARKLLQCKISNFVKSDNLWNMRREARKRREQSRWAERKSQQAQRQRQ